MKIYNKNYVVKGSVNKKIVLISDLHFFNRKDILRLKKLLDPIKNVKPDFICIPGDFTDKSIIKDEDLLLNWLKELSNITKVIISIGNHEFYANKHKKIYKLNEVLMNKISSIKNIYLLDNKNKIIDDINFMGITLPVRSCDVQYINNLINNLNVDKNLYNILLCHSPIDICKKEILENSNINLVLSGHMHGGITPRFLRPIFKNRGIISPNRVLFPKYAYGYIKIGFTDVIITSGIKVFPNNYITKLFSPEIADLTIMKNNV